MPISEFPEKGILWRGWNDDTLSLIEQKQLPVLFFVADVDPLVWPFLRTVFKDMPKNEKLRELLHDTFPALFIKAGELPEQLNAFGAGSKYHFAVLSPSGLTPLVTFDAVSGKPLEIIDEIVRVLERLREVWR
jgi:hypothetical protein